jgi:hypothetical protein
MEALTLAVGEQKKVGRTELEVVLIDSDAKTGHRPLLMGGFYSFFLEAIAHRLRMSSLLLTGGLSPLAAGPSMCVKSPRPQTTDRST